MQSPRVQAAGGRTQIIKPYLKAFSRRNGLKAFSDCINTYLYQFMSEKNVVKFRGSVLPVMGYFFQPLAIYKCCRLFLFGHESCESF